MHPHSSYWTYVALSTTLLLCLLSLNPSTSIANAQGIGYLGCYPDTAPTHNFPDPSSRVANDGECRQRCSKEGAKYAAIQLVKAGTVLSFNKGECRCGNVLPAVTTAPDATCQTPCGILPTNSGICGGALHEAVYSLQPEPAVDFSTASPLSDQLVSSETATAITPPVPAAPPIPPIPALPAPPPPPTIRAGTVTRTVPGATPTPVTTAGGSTTVEGSTPSPTAAALSGQNADAAATEGGEKGSFFGSPVLMGVVFGGVTAFVLVPMTVMSCLRWQRRRSESKRAFDTPFHSTQKRLQPITAANFVEPDLPPVHTIPGSPALGPSDRSGFPTRPRPSPGYASPSLGPSYQVPMVRSNTAFSRADSVISLGAANKAHYPSPDGFPPRSPAPYAPPLVAGYGSVYGEYGGYDQMPLGGTPTPPAHQTTYNPNMNAGGHGNRYSDLGDGPDYPRPQMFSPLAKYRKVVNNDQSDDYDADDSRGNDVRRDPTN